ncbi:MAG: glycosyltransferase [Thermoanaerobaculia bacterium]
MTLLEGLALLPLVFWLLLTLDRGRRWPWECYLPAEVGEKTPVEDYVVAVVPARDEAALLPATLRSLLGQEIGTLRVIVVDDGSTDGTAEVARAVARETGEAARLEVIAPPPTPPGWSGKVWALAQGVAEMAEVSTPGAGPEWLLFTDADIEHRPGSVRALLERAGGETGGDRFDLVSVMARLRADTFWERLLIPAFVFFFQLLYPFRRVQDPGSRVAAAAGGCVLIRRQLLEDSGGLEGISGALIDDVALAKQVKRAGGRLWLGFDPGVRSLRPYNRLGQIWRMVARSAFDQLHYRLDLLVLVLLGLLLLVAAPPLLAALGALQTVTGTASVSVHRALIWAALAWGLEALALLPSVRHHRVAPVFALGLPLAAVFYGLMTAGSAWSHLAGRGTRWKGRTTT